jgi:phenylpropionate dioxygenase-like ring-hydroxylating dioxygenase large terminal subunit
VLQSEQIAVGNKLLEFIDTESTALANSVYHQPVLEYISAEHAAIENSVLFRDRYLCIGLGARLPTPGCYLTETVSGTPILVTRDEQNAVHGFLNVCRHRGSRVADGCGRSKSFACPYHAWTYDLHGRLIARPQDKSFPGADRSSYGLTPLPVIERDGLIWLCPTPDGHTNPDWALGDLSAELAAYDFDSFHHYDGRIMHRQMNWKLVVDTFLESYHFCVLHKNTICSIFYDNLATFDAWGLNFRLVSARRTISELRLRPESEWNLKEHIVSIYVLFPNTVLVWQLDHVELWHIYPDPDNHEHAVMRLDLYIPERAETESAKRHWDKNLDLVVKVVEEEDFPVGETIQAGFHSGAQDCITFGTNEPALAYYHKTITEATTTHATIA